MDENESDKQEQIFGINVVSIIGIIFGLLIVFFAGRIPVIAYLNTLACENSRLPIDCTGFTFVAYSIFGAFVFCGCLLIARSIKERHAPAPQRIAKQKLRRAYEIFRLREEKLKPHLLPSENFWISRSKATYRKLAAADELYAVQLG